MLSNNSNNNPTTPAAVPTLDVEAKTSWISDDKLMDIISAISVSDSNEKNIDKLKNKLAYIINMEVEIKARGLQREVSNFKLISFYLDAI